ncbi:MAG: hypothetical protein J0H88_08475 [Sphingomonadales bacterium]|nr:hypothetical protein [Sphingomonadales bacterium]
MGRELTRLRNVLVNAFGDKGVPANIRSEVERVEARVADLTAKKAEAEEALAAADEVLSEERDADIQRLADDLEPIFAAIQIGDIDRARGGVRQLAGTLGGNDPIILAIQRAKARPQLHLHVAA